MSGNAFISLPTGAGKSSLLPYRLLPLVVDSFRGVPTQSIIVVSSLKSLMDDYVAMFSSRCIKIMCYTILILMMMHGTFPTFHVTLRVNMINTTTQTGVARGAWSGDETIGYRAYG